MPPQQMHCLGFSRHAVSPGSEETEPGEPTTLRPAGTIPTSQSRRLPAVTVPALSSSPWVHPALHFTHAPLIILQISSTASHVVLIPALLRAGKSAPRSIIYPDRTAQTKISKENPSKSSSCPVSRQVSLPPPQIKGTDVKLMPRLITAKKPRGLQTFIHLELQARPILANQVITLPLPQHKEQPCSGKVSFLPGTLLRAGLRDLQESSPLLRDGAGNVGLDSAGLLWSRIGPRTLELPARDERL